MRIGAHISIAKGIPKAIEMCKTIGANTYQFFTRNPRGGARRDIPDDEIAEALELAAEYGVAQVVAHLPYTINMASPKERSYNFAREALLSDLVLLHRMQAPYAVVHPGSHVRSGVETGMQRIVDAITETMEQYDGDTMLLLETMAGQGTEIGGSFDEIAELLGRLSKFEDNIGVCMDSAHLFGAGYDLRTPEGVDEMLQKADAAFGLDRVKAFHLNDSKVECGSNKDRHEKIGEGLIGADGVASIVNNDFIAQLPIILETPVDKHEDYAPQIARVKELAQLGWKM